MTSKSSALNETSIILHMTKVRDIKMVKAKKYDIVIAIINTPQ